MNPAKLAEKIKSGVVKQNAEAATDAGDEAKNG